jgi:phosphonate transport system permease protein
MVNRKSKIHNRKFGNPMTPSSQTHSPTLAAFLSFLIPGAGQVYARERARGIAILVTTLSCGAVIYWAQDNFRFAVNTNTALMLWTLFGAFAIWNIVDAYRRARNQRSGNLIGLLLPTVIIYVVAWQITDIRLERLVTRFSYATKIWNDIIHPDLFFQDAAGNWQPSENFGYIFGTLGPETLVEIGAFSVPVYHAGKIVETIALGLMATLLSTLLAVPLSFVAAHNIISRVRGGTVIYYAIRTLLNIVRAVDTLIWGVIVVVWVGLGPFAGVLALTIHSVAALGKLFSEEVEHIDPGPIEAVTATGANLVQTIRYAVIPQIIPSFLAFTLLRWDINMRSATIVGMVAGGGIGFYIVETLRKSAYPQYAAALWAIAIVIMIVDFVSARWRARIMAGDTQIKIGTPKPFYTSLRAWLYLILGLWAFVYCWQLSGIDFRKMFEPGPNFLPLIRGFLSFNLDPDVTDEITRAMMQTIFQALLATTLGALVAIPFSFLAARNLTGRSRLSIWIYYLTRTLFNVLRSIEALLYVAIFFYWVSFGDFAGMLALAVTTFALIGKLFSEAIENIDTGPLEAIQATGATRLQAIVYGILPQIIPPFISYAIYQWDINVRMATVVGFAGGGGIGLLLYTKYFPFMSYRSAGTAVALIVIVVAVMDFASAKIREKMV